VVEAHNPRGQQCACVTHTHTHTHKRRELSHKSHATCWIRSDTEFTEILHYINLTSYNAEVFMGLILSLSFKDLCGDRTDMQTDSNVIQRTGVKERKITIAFVHAHFS